MARAAAALAAVVLLAGHAHAVQRQDAGEDAGERAEARELDFYMGPTAAPAGSCVGTWGAFGSCYYDWAEGKTQRCRSYNYVSSGCPLRRQCVTSGCTELRKDCVGRWGNYGACTYRAAVNQNVKCRSYQIVRDKNVYGTGCPYAHGHQQCRTTGCNQPVDCEASWSSYSSCSYDAATHQNKRCRTYEVTTAARDNGRACALPHGHKYCTATGCTQPIDCEGEFSDYGVCQHFSRQNLNKKCMTYRHTVPARFGGKACPHASGAEVCTAFGCDQPLSCLGSWTDYGICAYSSHNHENKRCRQYGVTRNPEHGGTGCPFRHLQLQCTTEGCGQPLDCQGEWGSYGACVHVRSENKNERCRFYQVTRNAEDGGYGCDHRHNQMSCTDQGCAQPQDCVGEWTDWSECVYLPVQRVSKRYRLYTVTTTSNHHGRYCPHAHLEYEWSEGDCAAPVDCEGTWSSYGACNYVASEHQNKKCKSFSVTQRARNNGRACLYGNNHIRCTPLGCDQPVDCEGAWSGYGACVYDGDLHANKKCRTYSVTASAENQGNGCPYADATEMCTTVGCNQPVDCQGAWEEYGACDSSGERCRTYRVTREAENGGTACAHADEHTECTTSSCDEPVDCEGEWGAYGACLYFSSTRENKRCRNYQVTVEGDEYGRHCPHADGDAECSVSDCSQPVDCAGVWSEYGACFHDADDHENKKCRRFAVTQDATHNGHGCLYSNDQEQCTLEGCDQPVDCVGSWGAYGSCTYESDSHENKKCRKYEVVVEGSNSGFDCPNADGFIQCVTSGCDQPVNCDGDWGEYGDCEYDVDSHENKKCREYLLHYEAMHNGYGCPYAIGSMECVSEGCSQPVDCVGDWEEYGSCIYDNDSHQNKKCRTYVVSTQASEHGRGCAFADGFMQCTEGDCSQPEDCEGAFGDFGECSYYSDAHQNMKCQTYAVSSEPANNGYGCPHSPGYLRCSTEGCAQPVDCVGDWGEYDSCSYENEYHQNSKCRKYSISQPAENGGYNCPFSEDSRQCVADECAQPVNCVGSWSDYGMCAYDISFHENRKCRTFDVSVEAQHGGFLCSHVGGSMECITDQCDQPVDCQGIWSAFSPCAMNETTGTGVRCRQYSIAVPSSHGGYGCDFVNATEDCVEDACGQYSQEGGDGEFMVGPDGTYNFTTTEGSTDEDDEVSSASVSLPAIFLSAFAVLALLSAFVYKYYGKGGAKPQAQGSKGYHNLMGQNGLIPMHGNRNRNQTVLSNPMFPSKDQSSPYVDSSMGMPYDFGQTSPDAGTDFSLAGFMGSADDASVERRDTSWENPLFSAAEKEPVSEDVSIKQDMTELYEYLSQIESNDAQEHLEIAQIQEQVEAAMVTWNEVECAKLQSGNMGGGLESTKTAADFEGDLHTIKQSLNKIEQRAFMSRGLNSNAKCDLSNMISKTRTNLRRVSINTSQPGGRAASQSVAEWKDVRSKMRAIAKFKAQH